MNKKPAFRLWLLGLSASALACTIVSSAPEASKPPDTAPPSPTQVTALASPTAQVHPTPTPTSQPVGMSPENPVPFSETVVTAGWEITVLQFVRGEEALAMLKEASPFNKAHSDPSMEYALVKVRAKWTGEGTNRVDATFFSGMDNAMVKYERVKITDIRGPSPSISSFDSLASGDEVEGWVVIQIGKDAGGAMLVVWPRDNGMILGEETIRYVALEP